MGKDFKITDAVLLKPRPSKDAPLFPSVQERLQGLIDHFNYLNFEEKRKGLI